MNTRKTRSRKQRAARKIPALHGPPRNQMRMPKILYATADKTQVANPTFRELTVFLSDIVASVDDGLRTLPDIFSYQTKIKLSKALWELKRRGHFAQDKNSKNKKDTHASSACWPEPQTHGLLLSLSTFKTHPSPHFFYATSSPPSDLLRNGWNGPQHGNPKSLKATEYKRPPVRRNKLPHARHHTHEGSHPFSTHAAVRT